MAEEKHLEIKNQSYINFDVDANLPNEGLYAPTPEALREWLNSIKINDISLDEYIKDNPNDDICFFEIRLKCGCIKTFKYKEDIPLKSLKCKHGNYFIRIGDEAN